MINLSDTDGPGSASPTTVSAQNDEQRLMPSPQELQQDYVHRLLGLFSALRDPEVNIVPGTDFSPLRDATHVYVSQLEESFVPRSLLSPRFVPLDNYPLHDVEQIYILRVPSSADSYRIVTRHQPPHWPHSERWHQSPNNTPENSSSQSETDNSTTDTNGSSNSSPESETDDSTTNGSS
ncbi:hypothetical protein DFP72DRAFT_1063887 [Ephemerocybe angulata]|uniref:Uncharacterized protein n=1 Tax=Ephemerocybe angulata TaxID=980116 RepID=A0A8H6I8M0_9AGAR|nr:hypothetical protein DFP72DRAFT_1063887 [Tulosesus angulatus]